MREVLSMAMARLLARGEGFRSLSVEALAREAGVARSSFYLHFRNKNELIAYALQGVYEAVIRAGGAWFEHPESVSRGELDAAVRRIVGVYERHRPVMQAAIETAASDPAVGAAYRDILRRLMQMNRRTLRRAAGGQATRAVTPEVGDVLLLMVERCSYQLRLVDDPAQRERTVEALGQVFWHSLFGPGG